MEQFNLHGFKSFQSLKDTTCLYINPYLCHDVSETEYSADSLG